MVRRSRRSGALQCDAVLLTCRACSAPGSKPIPAQVPIRAPTEAARRWKKRLAYMEGFKVGAVWAGNPDHVNDTRRSIDLAQLEPLFAVPGTSLRERFKSCIIVVTRRERIRRRHSRSHAGN